MPKHRQLIMILKGNHSIAVYVVAVTNFSLRLMTNICAYSVRIDQFKSPSDQNTMHSRPFDGPLIYPGPKWNFECR